MTDNRATELRISEPLRGFIRHQSNRAYIDGGQARWLTKVSDDIDAKHEQSIAATLGSGTLTAEQVREAAESHYRWRVILDADGFGVPQVMFDWQAIADELNELGSGTCHCKTSDNAWCFACSACGKSFPRNELHLAHNHGEINYCPNCGAKVVEE